MLSMQEVSIVVPKLGEVIFEHEFDYWQGLQLQSRVLTLTCTNNTPSVYTHQRIEANTHTHTHSFPSALSGSRCAGLAPTAGTEVLDLTVHVALL